MRCPNCGNESELLDEYVCSYCGFIIIKEPIERFPIFARVEEKWDKADPSLKRIFKVITNPRKAFFDIRNKSKDKGPLFIKLFLGLAMALMAMAVYWHGDIQKYSGDALTFDTQWFAFVQGLSIFLLYFFFGIIYYTFLFWIFDFVFSLGMNFSVQYDDILRVRFNVMTKKNRVLDVLSGKQLRTKMKMTEQDMQITQLKQTGKMYTKIAQTGKSRMMHYAYAPYMVIMLISSLILLVALPNITISDTGNYNGYDDLSALSAAYSDIYDSFLWQLIVVLQILTVAVWIPVTLSLAMRELGNTNTFKILIGNFIAGIILVSILFIVSDMLGLF